MTLACTVGEEIHVIAGWNCHCDLRQPNGDRPPKKHPKIWSSWWVDGTQPIWKNVTVSQIGFIFPKEKGETEQIFETPTNVMFFVPRKFNVISLLTTILLERFLWEKIHDQPIQTFQILKKVDYSLGSFCGKACQFKILGPPPKKKNQCHS